MRDEATRREGDHLQNQHLKININRKTVAKKDNSKEAFGAAGPFIETENEEIGSPAGENRVPLSKTILNKTNLFPMSSRQQKDTSSAEY